MYKLKDDFCCVAMKGCINDPDASLHYLPQLRYYTITAPTPLLVKAKTSWGGYTVTFCPYCGIKLPNDLIEERMDILEKEYGIDDIYDVEQKSLSLKNL